MMGSTANTNYKSPYTPVPRVRRKKTVNVETNTEPWQLRCQKCTERNNLPDFTYTNNYLDINQYVSAINYINSIHNSINESLSNQYNVQTSDGTGFIIPDLPNFLTIVSGMKKNPRRISKSTSTSSLLNRPVTATNTEQNVSELKSNDHCWSEINSNCSPTSPQMSEVGLEGLDIIKVARSVTEQNDSCQGPNMSVENNFDLNLLLEQHSKQIQAHPCKPSKNVGPEEYLLECKNFTVNENIINEISNIKENVYGGDVPYEQYLSDAEIDHYASELFSLDQSNGEQFSRSASYQKSNEKHLKEEREPFKRKLIHKMPTTKQIKDKTKIFTLDSLLDRPGDSMLVANELTSIGLDNKKMNLLPKSTHSSIECGIIIGNNSKLTKSTLKTVLNPKTPVTDFRNENLKASSLQNKQNKVCKINKGAITLDPKNSERRVPNKITLHTINQKGTDDLLCKQKRGQKIRQTSESTISPKKELVCNNDKVFKERNSKKCSNSPKSTRSSENNSCINSQSFIPTTMHKIRRNKSNIQNKLFRQMRKARGSDNDSDILNINNYISQQLKYAITSTSNSTISSDIKSDKEVSENYVPKPQSNSGNRLNKV